MLGVTRTTLFHSKCNHHLVKANIIYFITKTSISSWHSCAKFYMWLLSTTVLNASIFKLQIKKIPKFLHVWQARDLGWSCTSHSLFQGEKIRRSVILYAPVPSAVYHHWLQSAKGFAQCKSQFSKEILSFALNFNSTSKYSCKFIDEPTTISNLT